MKAQWLNKRGKLTKHLPSSKSWNLTIKYAEWFVLESKKKDKIGQEKFFFSSNWRTDAEIWGLGGDTSGKWKCTTEDKKKEQEVKGFHGVGFLRLRMGSMVGFLRLIKWNFVMKCLDFWVFKCKVGQVFVLFGAQKMPKTKVGRIVEIGGGGGCSALGGPN